MAKPKAYPIGSHVVPVRNGKKLDFKDAVPRTKQEFLAECNINNIMEKYAITGQLPHGRPLPATENFGDFSEAQDYRNALAVLERAGDQFASLPAKVRDRFNNNPEQLLSWLGNGEAIFDEAHDLGLLTAEAATRVVANRSKKARLEALLASEPSATPPAVPAPPTSKSSS